MAVVYFVEFLSQILLIVIVDFIVRIAASLLLLLLFLLILSRLRSLSTRRGIAWGNVTSKRDFACEKTIILTFVDGFRICSLSPLAGPDQVSKRL